MNNILKLNKEVAVFALGGLGEVGKNMYVIQYEDELIIVDSGILFPDEYLLGIDYVIPDYSYLVENQDKIKALIVSHGHEDHIGGIPFLVQQVNIPVIYASGLSYGLIEAKLEEKVSFPVNLKKFSDDDVIKFNKLEIDFFRTNHSIPDTFGIRVKTPVGVIVHTGDFKFDFSPTGKDSNYHKMARIGEEGVLCLLSDSTNAELEEKVSFPVNLKKFSDDDVIKFNKLEIDFFRTNHSIPDTFGIRVKTPVGVIVHTGDFKFDFSPTGKDSNYHKMARIGEEGVLCLLSDSTNAELEDFTTSEKVVSESIREMFEDIEGRVIIATFASNIHRIQQIIEASVASNRKIAVFGRSMVRNIEVGEKLGYIKAPKDTFINTRNRGALKKKNLTIISTGSQGEPFAALTRISNKTHRQISLMPGDTVILSSSPIPGNLESINKTINMLQKNGAHVITQSPFADVHSSGHGGQGELKLMLKLMKPKYFAPIHGEHRMLKAHQKLAVDTGVKEENTFILENGTVLAFSKDKAYIKSKVKTADVYVDSESIGEVGSLVIKDRRELSEDGLLSVVLTISQKKYDVICVPNIVTKGFIFVKDNIQMIKDMQKIVLDSSKKYLNPNQKKLNINGLKNDISKSLKSYVKHETNREPMIMPIIMLL